MMNKTESALIELLGLLLKANRNREIMRAFAAEGLVDAYIMSVKDSLKSLGPNAVSEFERRNQTTIPTVCLAQPVVETGGDLGELQISSFMRERIENGELEPDDVPLRLARYGLMAPEVFREEMRERMLSLEH